MEKDFVWRSTILMIDIEKVTVWMIWDVECQGTIARRVTDFYIPFPTADELAVMERLGRVR